MKTATFKLLNLHGVLFILLFVAAGCQKEEFAEKDYLVNPFANVPPEDVDPNTTGGSTGGTTGSTDGSTSGGSTTGATSGGTTGSTDGSTSGGSTTGSTTGGTTGSTTGGTTGSTDGSSTGGSTAGSTTGSTAGGTTGSTSGGTTGSTSGSTSGGTTGSTTGGTTGVNPQWMDESFTQVNTSQRKLDILWVIDSSGSMADEQTSLGNNFDLFINDFIDRGVDFKMSITTTDVTNGRAGLSVTNSQTQLTSAKAQANRQQFLTDFKNMVRVGISGSGNERGLQGAEAHVTRYPSWLRSDAYFVTVYVSDEEDQSPKTTAEYLNFMQATKSSAGFFKAYSIVGISGCPQGLQGYTCGYQRYDYVSSNSGGTTADITGNFASILIDMGQSIITLLDTFPLSHDVIPGTMEVRFNGVVQASGWSVSGRQLQIDAGSVPPVGTNITVRYQYQ